MALPIGCPSRSPRLQANFPLKHCLSQTVTASQTAQPPASSPYTHLGYPVVPGVPVPLGPLCPKGFAWQENWLTLRMLHGEVMNSEPSHRALPLLAVARTNAQCHGPCMGRSCCHQQTQLPVFQPGPPRDMNAVTSKGRARLLTVSLELLGGGQQLVTCTLHAGKLQRLLGHLGL